MARSTPSGLRIVVVGATGALGKEVVAALDDSALPIRELVPVASQRSLGADVDFRGEEVFVESALPVLRDVDLLILCTPAAVSLELARQALRAEVACIDCSGALGDSPEVPIVVAELGSRMDVVSPLVAVPAGIVTGWAYLLAALDRTVGVARAVGTVLQPAVHAGREGMEVLSQETIALLSQSEVPESDVFPAEIAFDCIPITGSLEEGGGGATAFEARLRADLRRVIRADLEVVATCVQVPTFVGEGSTLAIRTRGPSSPADAAAALEKAPGIEFITGGDEQLSTRATAGRDCALVGRLRRDPSDEQGLLLWLATDGLRLVALNVAKIAETRPRQN